MNSTLEAKNCLILLLSQSTEALKSMFMILAVYLWLVDDVGDKLPSIDRNYLQFGNRR